MFSPMVPKLSLDIFCVPCTFGVVPFFWNKNLFRKNLAPRNLSGINLGTTPRRHHTWGFDRKPARFPQPMGKRWGNLCQSDSAISSCDLIIHNWTTRQLGTCPCIGTVSFWMDWLGDRLHMGTIFRVIYKETWYSAGSEIDTARQQDDDRLWHWYRRWILLEPKLTHLQGHERIFWTSVRRSWLCICDGRCHCSLLWFQHCHWVFCQNKPGKSSKHGELLSNKSAFRPRKLLGLFGYKQTCWIFHHWTCV